MIFSSIEFLFLFLPAFLLLYYILPEKYRNIGLLAGSLFFYALGSQGHPEYLAFLLGSLLVNYVLGLIIGRWGNRLWLFAGITGNVLCLGICKYYLHILPMGISFYTFQAISYLCDIYGKRCRAESSPVRFGVYLSMFPQLIAGPIVRYPEIRARISHRSYRFETFLEGVRTFILGLGSKVILANHVGNLWNKLAAIGYESISTPLAWMGIIAFSFQIYFDFLGYSLMAMGLGKMLGFDLPENFRDPYLATSMTQFWRRWHITLGRWFREYVYIPLGGNRLGRGKTYRNLFLVWLLTGLWHGATWNFAAWGICLFLLLAVEKAGLYLFLERHRVLGHLYMLLCIPLTWVLFAISDPQRMLCFFGRLFGADNTVGVVFAQDYIKYGKEYGIYLVLCLLFVLRLPQKMWDKLRNTYGAQVILVGIFALVVYFLYRGLNDPFLYYQF